jgi:hypothetical protein
VAGETAPAHPPAGGLRRVARAILWPLRRFFDPRFAGIHNALVDLRRLVITDMEAANETATLTGRTLDRLVAQNEAILARLEPRAAPGPGAESLAFAYVFSVLSALPADASVAIIGAGEPAMAQSLEALGYDVTTEHGIRTAHHEGKFAAVVCLGAVHDADRRRRLRHLTEGGGLLVLAVPVGSPDEAGLEDLLSGWERTDMTLVERRSGSSWAKVGGTIRDVDPNAETIALITATKRPA